MSDYTRIPFDELFACGPRFGMDPDTGEMWEYGPGEAWQGPLREGSHATITKVDPERGVVTYSSASPVRVPMKRGQALR